MAAPRAERSCRDCKAKKRRCDKTLPSCSLCSRVGRVCSYERDVDSTAGLAAMRARLQDLESRLLSQSPPIREPTDSSESPSQEQPSSVRPWGVAGTNSSSSIGLTSSDFSSSSTTYSTASNKPSAEMPVSLFLDFEFFQRASLKLSRPHIEIPADVLRYLCQENMVVETASKYFSTIHVWLPFISKKRMDLGIPTQNPGPDLAMLFLAMKLCISDVTEAEESSLYLICKNFLSRLESGGLMTLLGLQASILVALFEHIHAIYPAAWMSIGACARYAELVGVTSSTEAYSVLRKATSWTEVEERRRTWWALFALDRLSVLGNERSCALPQPPPEGRLPGDDEAWNSGDPKTGGIGHVVSADYRVHQSGFARLCQAAVYIDRARVYSKIQGQLDGDAVTAIMSFTEELKGFCANIEEREINQGISLTTCALGPKNLAHSALFLSLNRLACPESASPESNYRVEGGAKNLVEISVLGRAVDIIEQASNHFHGRACQLETHILSLPRDDTVNLLSTFSPFALDAIYLSALTLLWLWLESGDRSYRAKAHDLETHLDRLGERWRLAKAYSQLVRDYIPLFGPYE